MTEGELQAPCLKLLRTRLPAIVLRHADSSTSGVPDASVTWLGKTSWWEFKYGAKVKWANGLQQLTCRRLAAHGICHVVFYWTDGVEKETQILTPDEEVILRTLGFQHAFVLNYVKRIHLGN